MFANENSSTEKVLTFIVFVGNLIVFLCVAATGVLILAKIRVDGEFTAFLVWIAAPLTIIMGAWGIYRTWNTRKFTRIANSCSQQENQVLLHKFLRMKGYVIIREDRDSAFVMTEGELSFNNIWAKHILFTTTDGEIAFNIQKQYPGLNLPVLFTQILLKLELKRYLGNTKKPAKERRDRQGD